MGAVISVSELNERTKAILGSNSSVNDIWVSGEISNMTKHTSGHYYFTLKDDKSEIRCTMFKWARTSVTFEPAVGMKVAVFGSISIYVEKGGYQFNISTMRRSGIGDMYLALEELKKKLAAEGLFDQSRKRQLPKYPRTIGVVTSPTGAVIHDIIHVAGKRFPANILLAPVLVQGDGAPESIVKGLELINRQDVDVIIVGRGGGSAEDLWAFNNENVVRAIAASRVPVVSAVGHETDFTVADMVADLRAPTPSAAAEAVLPDMNGEIQNINTMSMRASRSLWQTVSDMNHLFRTLDAKLSPKRAKERVDAFSKELSELSRRTSASLRSAMDAMKGRYFVVDAKLSPQRAMDNINQYTMKLDGLSSSSDDAIIRTISDRKKDVASASMRLNSVSPNNVIERGYSLIMTKDGKALVSAADVKVGSEIEVKMRDGIVAAKVNGVNFVNGRE